MKKIILMLFMAFYSRTIILADETDATTDDQKNEAEASTESIKKESPSKTNDQKKEFAKFEPLLERKMFINCRCSPIELIATDKDNKQYSYKIEIGRRAIIDHAPMHIKKVICKDKTQEKDYPISQALLNSYAVFVFNHDAKPEQFNFIDIKQKIAAERRLKKALDDAKSSMDRDQQAIDKIAKKIEELQAQTIFLL